MRIGLAFSGGGIRGVVAARIGAYIEQQVGSPLAFCTDILAGTSTGGIIALGAALPDPVPMNDMVALYEQHGAEMFGKKPWRGWKGLFGAQYARKPLWKMLAEIYGVNMLEDLVTPTLITAYDRQTSTYTPFRSWEEQSRGVSVLDAALATSAAWPTYFTPHVVGNRTFIDGGFVANNPAAHCYANLTRLFPGRESYTIISIGTGEATKTMSQQQARKSGIFAARHDIVDTLFDGRSDGYNEILRAIPRATLHRLQPRLVEANHAMDDASPENIQALWEDVESFVSSQAANPDSALNQAVVTLKRRKQIVQSGKTTAQMEKEIDA